MHHLQQALQDQYWTVSLETIKAALSKLSI